MRRNTSFNKKVSPRDSKESHINMEASFMTAKQIHEGATPLNNRQLQKKPRLRSNTLFAYQV